MAAKQKYTQKEIIDALRETKGMIYLAAKRLGCEAKTIYNYRDRYPAVAAPWRFRPPMSQLLYRGFTITVENCPSWFRRSESC